MVTLLTGWGGVVGTSMMATSSRGLMVAAFGTAIALAAGPAWGAQRSVSDPVGDTQMMRGGPDIVSTKVNYSNKRVTAKITYSTAGDIAYATDGGTITGINMKFGNGKTYVLQRHATDPGWQTPQEDEILIGDTARRAKCDGVTSSVATAKKQVTVSAPAKCFKGKGTDLKARGFSFTVNFDKDETKWTRWIAQG